MTPSPASAATDIAAPPRVSVIIATHNFGQFIEEAVGSVLAQDVTDVEVIVVDDASTDDTPDRMKRITDPRVRSVRLAKVGVGAARNLGLELARGEFIAFLDADDRWRPSKLRRQMAVLEAEPDVGFVFTNFVRFDTDGYYEKTQFDLVPGIRTIQTHPSRAGAARVIDGDTFSSLAPMTQLPCWTQTMLVRADRIREIRFPADMRLSQDLPFVLNVYLAASGAMIDEPLVEVRRHSGNSYRRADQKLLPDIDAIARVTSQLSTEPHRSVARRRLARAWLALGYHHFWSGSVGTAMAAYARALVLPGYRLTAAVHLVAAPFSPVVRRAFPRRET